MIDCGGKRCGDDSSSCSSVEESESESESESEDEAPRYKTQTIAPRRAAVSSGRRR